MPNPWDRPTRPAPPPGRRPWDRDPAQLVDGTEEDQSPDSFFTLPNALRIVGGVGGGLLGSAIGPEGTVAGGIIGGGLGAGLGEYAAERLEVLRGKRKAVNPTQVATQTAIGAVPLGKIGSVASAFVKGAGLGAGASVATPLAEAGDLWEHATGTATDEFTSHLPSPGDVGKSAVFGGVFGAGAHAVLSPFLRPRKPGAPPPGDGSGPRPVPVPPPPGSPFRSAVVGRHTSFEPPPTVFPDPHEMAMAYQPNLPGAVQAGGRRTGAFDQGGANLPPLPDGFDELNRILAGEDAAPLGVRPDENPSLQRPLLPSGLDQNPPAIDPTPPDAELPPLPEGLADLNRELGDLNAPARPWDRPEGPFPSMHRPLHPSGLDAHPPVIEPTGGGPLPESLQTAPREPTDLSRPPGPYPPQTRPLVPSGLDANPPAIQQTDPLAFLGAADERGYSPVPFQVADEAAQRALETGADYSSPELRSHPLKDLVATQPTVTRSVVEDYLGGGPAAPLEQLPPGVTGRMSEVPGLPTVVEGPDGRMYLAGGTHRSTAAIGRGETEIQALTYPRRPAAPAPELPPGVVTPDVQPSQDAALANLLGPGGYASPEGPRDLAGRLERRQGAGVAPGGNERRAIVDRATQMRVENPNIDAEGVALGERARASRAPAPPRDPREQGQPPVTAPDQPPTAVRTAPEHPSTSGGPRFAEVDPDTVGVDARTYQFKGGGDAAGVTDRLAAVESWDPIAGEASPIIVHEKADGSQFVVDGHQRLGLAKRLKQAGRSGAPQKLRAIVLSERDGITVPQARRIGAMLNLQQGTGTATDVAKVLREAPLTSLERARIPKDQTSGAKLRMGEDLAKLGDDAFLRVINGQVHSNPARNEAFGAIVGRLIPDHAEQTGALQQLSKAAPDNAYEAEQFIKAIVADGFERGVQTDLFGTSEVANSLAEPIAKVMAAARRALTSEKSALGNAIRNETRLANKGNVLNRAANQAGVEQAGALDKLLDTYGHTAGPVREELKRVAAAVQKGDLTPAAAANAVLDALEAERKNLGAAKPPVRPGVQPNDGPGGPPRPGAQAQAPAPVVPHGQAPGEAPSSPGEARVRQLERQYGSDEAMGVTYDANEESHLPGDRSGVHCTSYAECIQEREGAARVKIAGFEHDKNPGAAAATNSDGHDFAVVDGRYVVDPYVSLVENSSPKTVFDLQSPADAAEIRRLYGDPAKWTERVRKDAGGSEWVPLKVDAVDAPAIPEIPELPTANAAEAEDILQQLAKTINVKNKPLVDDLPPLTLTGEKETAPLSRAEQEAAGQTNIFDAEESAAGRRKVERGDYTPPPAEQQPDIETPEAFDARMRAHAKRGIDIPPPEPAVETIARQRRERGETSALPEELSSLEELQPRHEVRNPGKATEIAESMKRVGWKGRPVLVVNSGGKRSAWTGTHRLAAAKEAGLNPKDVPRLEVDGAKLEAAGYNVEELTKLGKKARIEALRKAGLEDAAKLLEDERGAKVMRQERAGTVLPRPKGDNPRAQGTNPRAIARAEELLNEGKVDEAEAMMGRQIEARIKAALKHGTGGSDTTLVGGIAPFDTETFRRLVQKHPESAWRATSMAIGAATGWQLDEDHPGRGVMLGLMAGAAAGSLPKLVRALQTAEIKVRVGDKGKGGVEAVRVARDPKKDIGLFELVGGTPERTIPEQFEKARPAFEKFLKALHEEHARTKEVIPQKRVQALRDRYVTPVIAEIRRDVKALSADKSNPQPYKAKYITAFANRLAGHRTIGQRVFQTLTKGKLPADFIERRVGGAVYYAGTGFGVDTALQNLTQPMLASAHVPYKFIAQAYKDLATSPAAKRLVEGALLPLEKPADAIELTLGGFGRQMKNRVTAALDKVDPKRRRDPQKLLRMTDQKNREVVYYAARKFAESKGLETAAADTWARQVMRKTQTEPGALGTNPFHAGPVSGSLRPFTKYPTVFVEHLVDLAKQGAEGKNLGGIARLGGSMLGLVALGKATGIDLEDLLVSGGRPLGFDISHPQRSLERLATGKATPASRGAFDLMAHLDGSADHDLTEDAKALATPRYARKALDAIEHFRNEGADKPHVTRGPGGKIRDVTTPNETVLNLLGLKTTRQTDRRHALTDFYDKATNSKEQYEAGRRRAYEDLSRAIDSHDATGAREAIRRIGSAQAVRQFMRERRLLPEQRFFKTLPPKIRRELQGALDETTGTAAGAQ